MAISNSHISNMAIATVTIWLNNQSRKYAHGVMLYEQYGDKSSLKVLFKSGNSNFHEEKLYKSLMEINQLNNPPPKKILIGLPPPKPIIEPKAILDFENFPKEIGEIRKNKNQAYAIARKLFEIIPYMDAKKHRLEAGFEILDKMDFVADCWLAMDDWKTNGKIREVTITEIETAVEKLTLAELLREEKNLAPNVSKDKKKFGAATDQTKKLKLENRLKERIKRLELVKIKIAELTKFDELIQNYPAKEL